MKFKKMNRYKHMFWTAALMAVLIAAPLCAHPLVMVVPGGDEPMNSEQFLAEDELAISPSSESGSTSGGITAVHSHKDFGLSDEQLEKILGYKDQYEISTAGKKAELRSLMRKIENLMDQAILVDKKEILALNDKVSALNAELSTAYMNYLLSVNGELTAEQRKQMRHAMLLRELGPGSFGHAGVHPILGPHPFGGFGGPVPFVPPGFGPPPPFGPLPFGPPPFGPPPFAPHHFGGMHSGCSEPGSEGHSERSRSKTSD